MRWRLVPGKNRSHDQRRKSLSYNKTPIVYYLFWLMQVKYTDGEEEDYSRKEVFEGAHLFSIKNSKKRWPSCTKTCRICRCPENHGRLLVLSFQLLGLRTVYQLHHTLFGNVTASVISIPGFAHGIQTTSRAFWQYYWLNMLSNLVTTLFFLPGAHTI